MTLQEGFLPPCRHTACVQGKQIAPGIALSDSRWYTGTRMTQANLLQCSQSAQWYWALIVHNDDCLDTHLESLCPFLVLLPCFLLVLLGTISQKKDFALWYLSPGLLPGKLKPRQCLCAVY